MTYQASQKFRRVLDPDFLIIGAQKSGTTSLYHWLPQHPNLLMTEKEELHYFDREENYPDHDWYYEQFAALRRRASNKIVCGEKTPIYCFWPESIPRIFAFDPKIKLIMVLRNPIDRAISHYWMMFNRKVETLSIEQAFDIEETRLASGNRFFLREFSYLTRGRYHEQLKRIYHYFSREQLYIMLYEDMVNDPQLALNNLLDFLELPLFEFKLGKKYRVGSYPQTGPALRQKLSQYFAPHNAILAQEYGIDVHPWD